MRKSISSMMLSGVLAGLVLAGTLSAKPVDAGSPGGGVKAVDSPDENRELGASVSTTFGVYQPYIVPKYNAVVGSDEPAVGGSFENVMATGGRFPWNNYFTAAERRILTQHGFVVRPEAFATFGQAYSAELAPEALGSFVTVDAILHGLRVTATEAMREMERNYAVPALKGDLSDLGDAISKRLENERNQTIAASLEQLLGYVQTAEALLGPGSVRDPRVSSEVAAEVRKINAAAGEAPSSIFPQRTIDYAQFAPRGHYAADAQLAAFYKTAVWLSRVGFNVRRGAGGFDLASVRNAALLARMIDGMQGAEGFKQTLRNINEPAAFFSGHGERIATWDIVGDATVMYYGRIVAAGPQFLADESMLVGFAKYLTERLPDEAGNDPMLRLLEWEPAPAHTTLTRLWNGGRGIGILTALGSPRAAELAGTQSGFSVQESTRLNGPTAFWVRDMDHALLHTLRAVVAAERTEGYPRFMRSDAWRDREQVTALGAIADYLHAPATMQMQTMARAGRVTSGGADVNSMGYVEPNPEAWARIASLAGYIRSGLTEGRQDRLIGAKVEAKLRDIENVSAKLMQISAAELNGQDLTPDQVALIGSLRDRIVAYESFADKGLQGEGYVVTAGTAPLGGGTAPAAGHPMAVYVVVPRNDGEEGLMLTRGAVYSYYETSNDDAAFMRQLTTPSGQLKPDTRISGSYMSTERSVGQDPSRFYGLSAPLPATTVNYVPAKSEAFAATYRASLRLETSVVSRTAGEVWFTVRAPNLEGTTLVAAIANSSGQVVQHAEIGRVQNGERLDVLRVNGLADGEYFLKVEDTSGKLLATSRFVVVK